MNSDDWEKGAGVTCGSCGQETWRLVAGTCPACYRKAEVKTAEELEVKSMRRYYTSQLRRGTISLAAMRGNRLGDTGRGAAGSPHP